MGLSANTRWLYNGRKMVVIVTRRSVGVGNWAHVNSKTFAPDEV